MTLTAHQQIDSLIKWLIARAPANTTVTDDTILAEGVIVDSLEFVELLVLIENLRNESIGPEDMELDNFRTLRVIKDKFFSPGTNADSR